MSNKGEITAAALAAALAILAAPASAQMMGGEKMTGDKEKCYGVALKGQNDCASSAPSARSASDEEKGLCASQGSPPAREQASSRSILGRSQRRSSRSASLRSMPRTIWALEVLRMHNCGSCASVIRSRFMASASILAQASGLILSTLQG